MGNGGQGSGRLSNILAISKILTMGQWGRPLEGSGRLDFVENDNIQDWRRGRLHEIVPVGKR
jgi:hypothetical protein